MVCIVTNDTKVSNARVVCVNESNPRLQPPPLFCGVCASFLSSDFAVVHMLALLDINQELYVLS
jgi:hypothetical protein